MESILREEESLFVGRIVKQVGFESEAVIDDVRGESTETVK